MEAIIFDYGGVLCFHPDDKKIDNLANLCGLARDQFLEVYWSERVAYDRADFSPEQYWKRFSTAVGKTYTPEQIALFRRLDVEFWTEMDPVMLRWIREIRLLGIRVGLISNLPVDLGEYLRTATPLFSLFDHVTLSYEQRCVKPDAPIYLECCRGLNVDPELALFLDDREVNVRGAEAAGLKALIFETPAVLAEALAGPAHSLLPYGAPPIVV
jgi:putative hydrolase of the HAD superfamily